VGKGEEYEMTARSKLIALELAGGLFGWLWIIAGLVAIVCLIGALFGGWLWSRFFWALGISVVSKWLLRGLMENKQRIALEAQARGEWPPARPPQ